MAHKILEQMARDDDFLWSSFLIFLSSADYPGTLNTGDSKSTPGARKFAATTSFGGNLWLFGGDDGNDATCESIFFFFRLSGILD